MLQTDFDSRFGARFVDLNILHRRVYPKMKGLVKCNRQKLASWVPIVRWLPKYDIKSNLLSDLITGLIVGIFSVPQGMAYALVTGLDPVHGLYTSLFPPLVYSLFGTSKHTSVGPFAVLSLMVGAVLAKHTPILGDPNNSTAPTVNYTDSWIFWCGDPANHLARDKVVMLEVAASITILVGLVQLFLGALNAGFLSVYLSDMVVEGVTTGAAIHIFSTQVTYATGIKGLPRTTEPLGLVKFYGCLFMRITEIKPIEIVGTLICVAILFVVKEFLDPKVKAKFKLPIPIELILVIGTTLISTFIKSHETYGVNTLGAIPKGLMAPDLPSFTWFPLLIGDAFTIAIVIYCIQISLGKLLAKKHEYTIDPNQEWFALGICQIVASFFGCYCSGASLPRSMLQSTSGGKTQIVSFVSGGLMILVLYVLAPFLSELPKFVLASVIFVALLELFKQFGHLKPLFYKSKIDFLIWVVTFLGVFLLEVSLGLAVGVGFSLLTVIFRSQWPNSVCLGKLPGTNFYKEINAYAAAEEIPGVKIFRFDCNLYFANTELFKRELYKWTKVNPVILLAKQKKNAKLKPKWKRSSITSTHPSTASLSHVDIESGVELTMANGYGKDKNLENWQKYTRSSTVAHTASTDSLDSDSSSRVYFDTVTPPNGTSTPPGPPALHHIIIDCSPFTDFGVMSVDVLTQIYEEYQTVGITVFYAGCTVAVRQMLERCDMYVKVPTRCFYVSIHEAVQDALNLPRLSIIEDDNKLSTTLLESRH